MHTTFYLRMWKFFMHLFDLLYYSHFARSYFDRTHQNYTGFDSSIQLAFETAAETYGIIAEFPINAIICMTETININMTADDRCATGGVCCSPRTHTDTVRSVHWFLHTRACMPRMPMTWSLMVQGQSKLTVEVGCVYLIADKGLDLAPSYPEPSSQRSLQRNPPKPRDSSMLYGHGLGPWRG